MIQTVLSAWKPVLGMLGKPPRKQSVYRPSCFSERLAIDGDAVYFHTLTREMVAVPLAEENTDEVREWMKEHWFLVPEGTDEYRTGKQVRGVIRLMKPDSANRQSFLIFTTTDCNARCFYCFEKNCIRVSMTLETADAVAAYIKRKAGGQNVTLRWFGGEPLCNPGVIDRICERLRDGGVEYVSSVISNGYLFDEETVRKAVDLWKVKTVQITLDGTEEVYNKAKAYIYPDGNAYQTVKSNLGRLMDAGIEVIVRLNLDSYNADDLLGLVEELKETYGGRQELVVYSHTLFEEQIPPHLIEERRKTVYTLQRRLDDRLRDAGFWHIRRLRRKLKPNRCMADSGGAATILPDGRTGVCEHFTDSEIVGSIFSEEEDSALLAKWREPGEDVPACRTCVLYPECNRLKHCPDETGLCFSELQEYQIHILREQIRNEYLLWKENPGREPEEEEQEEGNC